MVPIFLLITLTLTVLDTAYVAELVATAARHVIAPIVLLHPEFTLRALLRAGGFGPFKQLRIHWQGLIIDLVGLRSNNRLLDLFTGLLHVIYDVAFQAVFYSTNRTGKVALVVVLLDEEVVTVFGWAFTYVCILIANLLPFKLLAPIHFLRR